MEKRNVLFHIWLLKLVKIEPREILAHQNREIKYQ